MASQRLFLLRSAAAAAAFAFDLATESLLRRLLEADPNHSDDAT
jgi:hypothetical protein